jgi:hypothetical protein
MGEVAISSPEDEIQIPERPVPVWTWAIDRVSDVLTRPNAEFWRGVAEEKCSNRRVLFAYLVPLLLAAWGFRAFYVAQIVGWGPSLLLVADTLLAVILLSFLLGVIADGIAPRFGGVRQGTSAFKLFAFLQTPVLVAMILEFLFSLAGAAKLGSFLQITGLMYGVYILWIALPAFFALGPKGNFVAFPVVIAMTWFILRSLVMTGVGFAFQTFYGENPLEDTLEAGFHLRSFSKNDMPQHDRMVHRIHLSYGTDYRFVFLARHSLSNIDLRVADEEGETLVADDPLDQDGIVLVDFSPAHSGTYYLVTEVGDLGGPSLRTETLLYTFKKDHSAPAE